MWQTNEVLRFDEKLYRILVVQPGEIVWICIEDNTAQPKVIPELQLISYIDESRLFRNPDPFASIHEEEPLFGSVAFYKREQRFEIIQLVLVDEQCFDANVRAKRINQIEQAGLACKAQVYKLLRRYWQRGQKPNALLPDYKNSGSPGTSRAGSGKTKAGRNRQFGRGEGVKVTTEIERLFRIVVEKHMLITKPLKSTAAYGKFKVLFHQHYPQIEDANKPTLRQFRYFFDREYKQPQRLTATANPSVYKKDIRPLTSTATANVLGPGSRYEIDATVADIYLVADDDRSKIIGRPTVYIVIDVFSRMIAGFYIGFDNPSYVVAMQSIVNACIDKTEICQHFGLDPTREEWPCIGLPDVILADRGEMMSHQVEALISGFSLRIESAPPRRGDAKGIVERSFRTLQSEFKPYAPGVVAGNKIKRHGEKDYRLDAVLTITDFTQIMLRSILFRNNHHVMDKYDRDAELPADVPSIPVQLWKWGMQHRAGSLRKVDEEQLRIALLPRKKATISPLGANMWGLYYSCAEFIRVGWLHRSKEIQRPGSVEAAYEPGTTDAIYLFPQPGSRVFWRCTLTERSRQFRGMSFWQVWELQALEKHNKANAKLDEDAKRRELDAFINSTITAAKRQSPKGIEPDSQRIKQIKANKKEARDTERRNRVKPLTVDENKKLAVVVPLKSSDEDYSFPSFVPRLFDAQEGETE